MKSVKKVAADEVRFMFGPLVLGLLVTTLGYIMVLRGDTSAAYWLMTCSLIWHIMALITLCSIQHDVKNWAMQFRGSYWGAK